MHSGCRSFICMITTAMGLGNKEYSRRQGVGKKREQTGRGGNINREAVVRFSLGKAQLSIETKQPIFDNSKSCFYVIQDMLHVIFRLEHNCESA